MAYLIRFKIRFSTPCLGGVRTSDPSGAERTLMLKNADGQVQFMASWWRVPAGKAAKSLDRCQGLVRHIAWGTAIDGHLEIFRRPWRVKTPTGRPEERFTEHEAFPAGSVVAGQAVIPDHMAVADFSAILQEIGRFYGISPSRHEEGYGRFEVLDVERG